MGNVPSSSSSSSSTSKVERRKDLSYIDESQLSAYEAACRDDPDVKRFDKGLQKRTEAVLATIANGGVTADRTVSFDTLKEVSSNLLEMDQEVVKIILEYKEDVWRDPDLFELVEDFFDNSLATLNFCSELDGCIRRARDNQLLLRSALALIPPAFTSNPSEPISIPLNPASITSNPLGPTAATCSLPTSSPLIPDSIRLVPTLIPSTSPELGSGAPIIMTEELRARVLKELGEFRSAGSPFGDRFLHCFDDVYTRHISLLAKLQEKKRRLDRRLKTARVWSKVSFIMFGTLVAAVLICSVVAAAVAAPPIAAAMAAASSLPLGTVGHWVKSLWRGYTDEIRDRRDVYQQLHKYTFVAIKDLETIGSLVRKLEALIESLEFEIAFAENHPDVMALQEAIQDIIKNRQAFVRDLDVLEIHIAECGRRIAEARLVVVQKISRGPERRRRRGGSF